jgi:hypothetical protein
VSQFSPGSNLGWVNPQAAQFGAYGVSPYGGVQTPGFGAVNPFLTPQLGGAISPITHPLIAAQLATTNPALLSYLVQQTGSGELAGQFPQGASGAWGASSGGGFSQPGQQPLGAVNPNILAQVLANPAIASDPVVGPLIAQQLNPLAQQQLPIRPLIGQQQFNPFQATSPGGIGSLAGQGIDPYAALIQAQLLSQLAAGPYQQIFRPHAVSPWFTGSGVPFTGQAFPFTQTGGAFGI